MLVEIMYGDAKSANPRTFALSWLDAHADSLGNDRAAVEWLLEHPGVELVAGLAQSDKTPAILTFLPDELAVLFRLTFPDFHFMLR